MSSNRIQHTVTKAQPWELPFDVFAMTHWSMIETVFSFQAYGRINSIVTVGIIFICFLTIPFLPPQHLENLYPGKPSWSLKSWLNLSPPASQCQIAKCVTGPCLDLEMRVVFVEYWSWFRGSSQALQVCQSHQGWQDTSYSKWCCKPFIRTCYCIQHSLELKYLLFALKIGHQPQKGEKWELEIEDRSSRPGWSTVEPFHSHPLLYWASHCSALINIFSSHLSLRAHQACHWPQKSDNSELEIWDEIKLFLVSQWHSR